MRSDDEREAIREAVENGELSIEEGAALLMGAGASRNVIQEAVEAAGIVAHSRPGSESKSAVRGAPPGRNATPGRDTGAASTPPKAGPPRGHEIER